ncbi:MAG: hypothetical protein V3U74_05995, partial [Thermodesulfobacteriota bacterium]
MRNLSLELAKRRSKQWRIFSYFIAGFVVLILLLWFRMSSIRSTAFETAGERKATLVRIIPVVSEGVWRTVSFLGRVEGGQTVQVRADVGGWVV